MSDALIDHALGDRPWPSRDKFRALYAKYDPEMRLAASRMPRVVALEGESLIDVVRSHYWLYLGALLGLGVPYPGASVLAADLSASMFALPTDTLGPVAGR